MLEHGGRLRQAASRYNIPLADWLDLSTGINPNGWPVPPLPSEIWLRLPEDNDGLEQAACDFYGTSQLLPVSGSQAAIQTLPQLREHCRVGVIAPGYNEHAAAWRRAGHDVIPVTANNIEVVLPTLQTLVLIHPNNPTGARFDTQQLLDWHAQLAARDGWLVVDEAFMDTTPENSLAPFCPRAGLIVLRSVGKFFGLAGARVGFVLADESILNPLREMLGPWTISAPARRVVTMALRDFEWQKTTSMHLKHQSERLANLLTQAGLKPAGGCALFQWIITLQAAAIHEALARDGILTRPFIEPTSLRFGLPADESGWRCLETALARLG